LKYKVIIVVGARPNFMKAAPVYMEIKKYKDIVPLLIHTGQHYDKTLSKVFFDELKLPMPDYYLGVGSGTHSEQTAKIMLQFEKILSSQDPDIVVVVGDVNSTLACALTSAKYRCLTRRYRPLIAHIEAGLRSFDWRMPEEINRCLTDSLSDLLFITEPSAKKNLIKEGIAKNRIFFVGNVMIDTLLRFKKTAEKSDILMRFSLKEKEYALLTMHRPTNVDHQQTLKEILKGLKEISQDIPIILPIHPRTEKMFCKYRIQTNFLKIIPPLGYLDFLRLMLGARFVLTDSGGVQEETTVFRIPCLTIRKNTERPITVSEGTNTIVGANRLRMVKEVKRILAGKAKKGKIPTRWDGKAAKRLCKILCNILRSG